MGKRKICRALAKCKQFLQSQPRLRAGVSLIKEQVNPRREQRRLRKVTRHYSPSSLASRSRVRAIAVVKALTTEVMFVPLFPKRSPLQAILTPYSHVRPTRNSITASPSLPLPQKLAIHPKTLIRSTKTVSWCYLIWENTAAPISSL